MVFSPDGHTLVAGGMAGSLVAVGWSRTGVTAPASVTGVAVSSDGRRVATGAVDGSVVLWPVDNPADQRRLGGHQGEVSQVAFNRDGTRLAVAGVDGISVWEVSTGRQIATLNPPDSALVDDVAFAPDGHTLVTSSLTAANDDEVDFWDANAFRLLGSLPKHDNGSGRVSYSPDGRMLATTGTGKVQLWDARTRGLVDTLDTGSAHPHVGDVGDVAFSPDGRLLAASVDNPADGTQNVQFWDVASRQVVGTLTGLRSTVSYIAFSPDSATLATVAQENVVRLWNVADRTPLATIDAASPGTSINVVAFSPVGRALVSGGSDASATYWTLDPDAQFAHLCQVLGARTFDVEWQALDPNIGPPPSCVGSSPS
jgi:WD40 repeat protein